MIPFAPFPRYLGPFARKVLLLLTALFVITYASISAIILFDLSAYQRAATRNELSRLASAKLNNLAVEFSHQAVNSRAWARLDVMNDLVTNDVDQRIARALGQMKIQYRLPGNIYAFGENGNLITSNAVPGARGRSMPSNWRLTPGDDFRFIDKSVDPYTGQAIVAFSNAVPAAYAPGKTIGYLVVTYPWQVVASLLHADNASLVVLNHSGEVLYNGMGTALSPAGLERLRAHATRYPAGRTDYMVAYAKPPDNRVGPHWQLAAIESSNSMKDYLHTAWEQITLGMVLLGVPLGVLTIGITYRFTRPLAELTATALEISKSSDLSKRVAVTGRDEVGLLQRAFNEMTSRLQQDIIERKKAETEIHNLAFFDPLTQLPNRRFLHGRVEYALNSSALHGNHGALMFIDLDHFKKLNDTKGHEWGDQLLIEVAKRLKPCVRTTDTIARLGGDEFVVLLEGLSERPEEATTQARKVAEKILNVITRPFVPKDRDADEYQGTCSIGISLFRGDETTLNDLLKQADIAMYFVKDSGRNAIRFFDVGMQSAMEYRNALETDLRRVLSKRQLRLYFQPQVDSVGRILGAEVLLRWEHPEHGLVSPVEFIPLAEETGLIVPIGLWVLETACAQLNAWKGGPHTRTLVLAINVSARQFQQPDFLARVSEILERTAVDPAQLKLELTESLILDNVSAAITTMRALKAMGIGFSMDDFGTGYSSLTYLKLLPLDQLKIDRSFIRNIATDPNDAAIVRTIIAMGKTLGMDVIAEGVETEAQREFLELQGCRAFQGYLFGKPLPLPDFEQLLGVRQA